MTAGDARRNRCEKYKGNITGEDITTFIEGSQSMTTTVTWPIYPCFDINPFDECGYALSCDVTLVLLAVRLPRHKLSLLVV